MIEELSTGVKALAVDIAAKPSRMDIKDLERDVATVKLASGPAKIKELEERFSTTRKFVDMRLEGIQLKIDMNANEKDEMRQKEARNQMMNENGGPAWEAVGALTTCVYGLSKVLLEGGGASSTARRLRAQSKVSVMRELDSIWRWTTMKATPQLNLNEIITLLLEVNPDFAIPLDDSPQHIAHMAQIGSQQSLNQSQRGSALGNLVISDSQGSLAGKSVGGASNRTGGKMLPGVSSVIVGPHSSRITSQDVFKPDQRADASPVAGTPADSPAPPPES